MGYHLILDQFSACFPRLPISPHQERLGGVFFPRLFFSHSNCQSSETLSTRNPTLLQSLGGLLEVAVVVVQRLIHFRKQRLEIRCDLRQTRQRGGLIGVPSGKRKEEGRRKKYMVNLY